MLKQNGNSTRVPGAETKLSDKELIEELKISCEQNKKSLQELKELNKELKKVNEKLTESEALKTHFISNITNEIVNPFTSILVLSKNILAVKTGDWNKVSSMAALIHSEAFNLDFQLKNIFAAAKLESGKAFPEISNVDINQLMQDTINIFKQEADKKQLSIDVLFNDNYKPEETNQHYFKTDPESLKLITANLLSNAIKFSNTQDTIKVKISKLEQSLNISIQDSGIGISKADQKIIFDRFKRLDMNIHSLNKGHGLGLSVIKSILDLMNGKIEIESEINQGSVFTVLLPEAKSETHSYTDDANEFIFGDDEIF